MEVLCIFRAFHLRPPSLATAGSARTRQGTLGSLDSPSAAASSDERRFFTRRRRKPRPSRRCAVASNNAHSRNAPQRASADHRRAARVGYCASAVGCGHCPPASAIARQQLAAGTARPRQRLCAASGRRSGCLNCILQFKFARKLARPPDCGRGRRMRLGELSSLLVLGSGGLGIRTVAIFCVEGVGLRRALPAPA